MLKYFEKIHLGSETESDAGPGNQLKSRIRVREKSLRIHNTDRNHR
jgi:hypothetical protein